MNTVTPNVNHNVQKHKLRKQEKFLGSVASSNGVSFKGAPATLITEADRKVLNVFSQHYGNVGERLGQKVGKLVTSSDILKKSSRFSLEQGALSIRDKSPGRALFENVLFPFVNLPLYASSWLLKKAQLIPAFKNKAQKLYNKPVLRIPRKLNELDSKTDMLKGIFDKTQDSVNKFAKSKGISPDYVINQINKPDNTPQAQQMVKEANAYIKENLYKVSNKFFDKHTGNFNTAYERPLNRIITGLVPVAFLANDAYNLSILCGDSKEEAKKEAKERRSQEISRVFTTAYIQLLTFGAFTKQVNTIPWFTPLTSAATVLFSEINSRRRLGKPIFFLSKEKAKEYNSRDKNKQPKETKKPSFLRKKSEQLQTNSADKNSVIKNNNTKQTYYLTKSSSEPNIFTSFKSVVPKSKTENAKNKNKSKEESKNEPKKALINFKTLKNAVIVLVTAGFALSFIKNSSYTKNSKLVKGTKSIGDFFKKKVYEPVAYKDFEISEEKFGNLTKSLKDVGCKEIAEGHEFIKGKYGKTVNGAVKMYKASISPDKVSEAAKSTIDKLKSSGISLSDKEYSQITEAIKTAVSLEGTSVAEKKYTDVAKKAAEIITNKKVGIAPDKMDSVVKTITESLAAGAKESPIKIETKVKPFADIITQPFKFIMSALKLPFKIVSSLVNLLVSPVEKKASQAALGKAELSKFEKGVHKVVTEIFGEKQAKSGKTSQVVFANAMEALEKKTAPYQKAEAAYRQAVAAGKPEAEIKKLRTAMDKAKEKLMIYVNTAVEKSFNGVTQSSNKNTDLAMMSKLTSSAVTSAFLVADNYNMVMLKSNGEDKEGAKEKANERIIQRLSALFYQTLLINWFNSTFRSTYNSSLKGMAMVAAPNTLTTEILTRKSIGMPIGRKTKEELQEIDEKNENRKGFAGKYFKFMRLLTGKKPLKDRMPKDKAAALQQNNTNNTAVSTLNSSSTTNLLELLSK